MAADFFTRSDSPVKALSSVFKSLLCMMTPSAGIRSPTARHVPRHANVDNKNLILKSKAKKLTLKAKIEA